MPDALIDRFWPKTGAQTVSSCIVWIAAEHQGRGYFGVNGKPRLAHRFIYERALGPIPPGKVVMHTCDNGLCVKLQHLDIGTQKQNIQDASAKGRLVGNRTRFRPLRKLTPQNLIDLKAEHAAGARVKDLAAKYELSEGHVYHILQIRKTKRSR